ncbi:Uma2 family endonuclease [Spirulina sp. 06S082]|uniref:Uma2 family endonuclease n=1 Tax=Spirulina sp. 06S082 TaxID=3110248 RepID=UPI002B1F93EA|nr:Uma2 family endonuclease [Spirulina sp. 06S082]MEA5468458.1 Uma2 family endonuclease [Spirulina sp. 06S082]
MNLAPLYLPYGFRVTREQFAGIVRVNHNFRLERTEKGELLVMPPTGGNIGQYTAKLLAQFVNWNEKTGLGVVFGSSTVFQLPNGAERSTSIAWVSLDRWNFLSLEQQQTFPPLCPDCVLELRSPMESMEMLREKMNEYLDNQLRLGWLIDLPNQKVEVYQRSKPVIVFDRPDLLMGENVLSGLALNLKFLWN